MMADFIENIEYLANIYGKEYLPDTEQIHMVLLKAYRADIEERMYGEYILSPGSGALLQG